MNSSSTTTKKIVIADDEPDILNILSILFRAKGFEVLGASDGQMALELIEQNRPAAAILDFMMPKLDGISVCKRVRRNHPNMFIIIMSGVGADTLKVQTQQAQANDYVEKPLRMSLLVERIRTELERQDKLETV